MTAQETVEKLTACGLRPTQQRVAVYTYLQEHRTHPTAETIYQALSAVYPTFSRTTIYNSLHALVDAGLIRALSIDPEERHFDAFLEAHGHFRCTVCGKLMDIPLDAVQGGYSLPEGYRVDNSELYLTGCCCRCAT
jgi:Fur family peroxide stress response transcriptional regulator